jgi:hypothetical protein
MYCTCLPSHIVEWLNTFRGVGEHEVGLTQHKAGLYSIKVVLVFLDLDCQHSNIIIDLLVTCDFLCQAPIVGVSHYGLEDVKVTPWTGEHVAEPQG